MILSSQHSKVNRCLNGNNVVDSDGSDESTQYYDHISNMQTKVDALQCRVSDLDSRVNALLCRDNPVDIRNTMKKLERWLCYEAAGSKSRFLRFFNLDRISTQGDTPLKYDLAKVFSNRGLNEDHLDTLAFLKECIAVPDYGRPEMTVSEWEEAICAYSLDGEEDQRVRLQLLDALALYCPKPSDPEAPWVITDPVSLRSPIHSVGNPKVKR